MSEMLFPLGVIVFVWIFVFTGHMDLGSGWVASILMYLWQILSAIHGTICEIRCKLQEQIESIQKREQEKI